MRYEAPLLSRELRTRGQLPGRLPAPFPPFLCAEACSFPFLFPGRTLSHPFQVLENNLSPRPKPFPGASLCPPALCVQAGCHTWVPAEPLTFGSRPAPPAGEGEHPTLGLRGRANTQHPALDTWDRWQSLSFVSPWSGTGAAGGRVPFFSLLQGHDMDSEGSDTAFDFCFLYTFTLHTESRRCSATQHKQDCPTSTVPTWPSPGVETQGHRACAHPTAELHKTLWDSRYCVTLPTRYSVTGF